MENSNKPTVARARSRWVLPLLAAMIVLVGAGVFLALRPAAPAPAPVVLLRGGFPQYNPTLFERYVPAKPGWAWAWKLREHVVGRPTALNVAIVVLECPELPAKELPGLSLRRASYADTNGLQLWFLSNPDLAAVTERIKQMPGSGVISKPRLSTSSGVECNLQAGKTFLGLLGYTHSDRTDLYVRFRHDDAGPSSGTVIGAFDSTALGTGLRMQVPQGDGVFLLNTDQKTGRRIGAALSLSFPKKKK